MEENNNLLLSNTSSLLSSQNDEPFDIRNLMNYDIIKQILIDHPLELSLFEVTCILINDHINNLPGTKQIISEDNK
jgi:hypothetical protein